MKDKSVFIFLTVNHNPMKMEKENKRKKVGVLTPNVAFLIAGLLFMASVSMLAADVVPVMDELKIESVNQKGRTITVTVLDEHGELIGANVIVKGTTIGNVGLTKLFLPNILVLGLKHPQGCQCHRKFSF